MKLTAASPKHRLFAIALTDETTPVPFVFQLRFVFWIILWFVLGCAFVIGGSYAMSWVPLGQ